MNEKYDSFIRNVADFPKPGIIFKDISPLLAHKMADVIEDLGKLMPLSDIDAFVGIESRGFIFASALAARFKKQFIMIRKKGKLPPPLIKTSYALEYGEDTIEMQKNDIKKNIIIVDDVLATGGTLKAAQKLCLENNYDVKGHAVLINLTFLNQMNQESTPIFSLLNY
jgi:adenine phosphoribosyltransferase